MQMMSNMTQNNNGINGSFGKMSLNEGSRIHQNQMNEHSNMMVTAYNNMAHQGSATRVGGAISGTDPTIEYGMMTGGLRMSNNVTNGSNNQLMNTYY